MLEYILQEYLCILPENVICGLVQLLCEEQEFQKGTDARVIQPKIRDTLEIMDTWVHRGISWSSSPRSSGS